MGVELTNRLALRSGHTTVTTNNQYREKGASGGRLQQLAEEATEIKEIAEG